jgi:outer membrane protein TolC
MLREKYEAQKQEIIKKVKYVYYDLYWVDKALQVTEEEKAIIETLENVAQRKYESKFAPQQDVVKAQVELSMLIKKITILKQHRESLVAKLNNLLNRRNEEKIVMVETITPDLVKLDLNELHELADESRQEILAAKLGIEKAEYEKSLAMMDYIPDVTFGFDYVQVGEGQTMSPNDGQDAWIGSIAFNIPLWFGRIDDKVKEKKLLLESSKQEYEGIKSDVYYEVEDIYFKILAYKDVIELYETALMPQTEQAFDAAKTGYESGKVDFLNWLESERTLLQTRLAYYKSIVDYQKSIAYLERVIGQDLSEGK